MSSMGGSGVSLGTLWIEISARVDEAVKVIEDFGNSIDSIIDEQKKKWEGFASVGESFLKLGGALTAGLTVPLAGVGTAAVGAAEQINTAKVAFTTMLGSGEAATAMLKDLQTFAATTPFEFPDLVGAAQRMKALGFETDSIIPTLRTIGDTVAASGKMSKDSIDTVISSFGKMQNSGKVTTEAMNMLTDKGVNAWQMLADASGRSVADVQKAVEQGLVPAAEAVPAILAGMNDKFGGSMDAMSKTLTGQWSNFKDQITQALIPIGNALIPALQNLLPILTSVLSKVAEGATWFSQLPDPVKNAALAVAALAAAAGPLLVGFGGMMTAIGTLMPLLEGLAAFFGTSVLALGPWALAIAGVTAALVALGTWVYQNWEPIVAALAKAWEGVQEAWGAVWTPIQTWLTGVWDAIAGAASAVWTPIANFFLKIWDAVAPYFTGVWTGIKSVLEGIWTAIVNTATAVWTKITSVFDGFIEAAKKIPGVSKFLQMDDAFAGAKKLTEQTAKLTTEVKSAKTELPKLDIAAGKTGKAAKKAADDGIKPLHFSINALEQKIKDEQAALLAGHRDFVKWSDAHKDAARQIPQLTAVSDDLNASITRIIGSMKQVPPAFLNAETQAKASMDAAVKKVQDLDNAYKTLGVTSSATLAQHASDVNAAYDKISSDANASITDIQRAWVAMEEANIAASRAAGDTITAERLKGLADMKSALDTELPKQVGVWQNFGNSVSTVITNFAQDIAKSLFDGDMSWGEKCKTMLKSLGQAVLSSFIEPATAAIGKFVSETISSLLSGDGLGGVLDSIKGIGSAMSGLFGAGAKAAGGAASAAGGVASGAGSAASGAAGAAGQAVGMGLSAVTGMVTGIVSAVTGVIGVFQSAHQETSLNAIEHNTRYSMMYLGERSDGGILGVLFRVQENTQYVQGQLDTIIGWLGPIGDFCTRLEPVVGASREILSNILNWDREAINYQRTQLDTVIQAINATNAGLERLAMGQERQIQITTTGSDPTIVAAKIAASLRAQGATA